MTHATQPVRHLAAQPKETQKASAIQPAAAPRLLDQMTEAARQHGHTEEAAKVMAEWCRQVILFHGKKHPQEMGRMEVNAYLGHVAKMEKDPLRGVAAGDPGLPPGRGYVP